MLQQVDVVISLLFPANARSLYPEVQSLQTDVWQVLEIVQNASLLNRRV
jgi:hypothetical protein